MIASGVVGCLLLPAWPRRRIDSLRGDKPIPAWALKGPGRPHPLPVWLQARASLARFAT